MYANLIKSINDLTTAIRNNTRQIEKNDQANPEKRVNHGVFEQLSKMAAEGIDLEVVREKE